MGYHTEDSLCRRLICKLYSIRAMTIKDQASIMFPKYRLSRYLGSYFGAFGRLWQITRMNSALTRLFASLAEPFSFHSNSTGRTDYGSTGRPMDIT